MTTVNTSRVIAVASGKGGVGKSNVAVNLAVGLAECGKSVLLMDADLGLANIDILLGIRPLYDLRHLLEGQRELKDILVKGPCGIDIVPAASGLARLAQLSDAEHAGLLAAFDELRARYEVFLIDTAAGISPSVIAFSKGAQDIIVVVCDEPTSITDAYALIKVLSREHGVKHFQILANQVGDVRQGRKLYAKLAAVAGDYLEVGLGYLGAVPLDTRLREAVRHQSPVLTLFPASASAVAFRAICERLARSAQDADARHPASWQNAARFPVSAARSVVP